MRLFLAAVFVLAAVFAVMALFILATSAHASAAKADAHNPAAESCYVLPLDSVSEDAQPATVAALQAQAWYSLPGQAGSGEAMLSPGCLLDSRDKRVEVLLEETKKLQFEIAMLRDQVNHLEAMVQAAVEVIADWLTPGSAA